MLNGRKRDLELQTVLKNHRNRNYGNQGMPVLGTNLWEVGNNVLPNFHSLMLFAKDNGNGTQNERPKIDQVLFSEWCQSGMLILVVGF